MKRAGIILSAALLLLPALARADSAGQPPSPPPQHGPRVVAEVREAQNATVKAVDLQNRTVTLSMPDGREQTLLVDRSVRKLDQVKPGDTVKIRYREAVSVKLNKTPVAPETKVEGSVQRDEKSVKPAGKSTLLVTTTATIDRIFSDGNMVTLRLPDGTSTDVQVRDPRNLAMIKRGEVKPGDQIEITYLRALAVSVEKSAPK